MADKLKNITSKTQISNLKNSPYSDQQLARLSDLDIFVNTINTLIDENTAKETATITDLINESTSGAGVTVDGVLIKDGGITLVKGTVTQGNSVTTTVILNAPTGIITSFSATTPNAGSFEFTVTNAFSLLTSNIQVTVNNSASAGIAHATVNTILAGSFRIKVFNVHPVDHFNGPIKITFTIV